MYDIHIHVYIYIYIYLYLLILLLLLPLLFVLVCRLSASRFWVTKPLQRVCWRKLARACGYPPQGSAVQSSNKLQTILQTYKTRYLQANTHFICLPCLGRFIILVRIRTSWRQNAISVPRFQYFFDFRFFRGECVLNMGLVPIAYCLFPICTCPCGSHGAEFNTYLL